MWARCQKEDRQAAKERGRGAGKVRGVIEGCLFWILFFKPRKMELSPQESELASVLWTF